MTYGKTTSGGRSISTALMIGAICALIPPDSAWRAQHRLACRQREQAASQQ
jgi:hypothetical protein